ncbi:MAG: HI0074 family nucleotidyltransferase substrate-binding subunit, partial [Halobacteriovoraceae bacterium]|nr:HI0074 family nucleotidyltransferase substrate-binding subunit [Halobacteriovoraceae bacterium]
SLDLSSLENSVKKLEEGMNLFKKEDTAMFKESLIYRFQVSYDVCIKMIKRYLKEVSCNPGELAKMTFTQIVREANKTGIITHTLEKWKKYRECRSKVSHIDDEKIEKDILSIIPDFLKELSFVMAALKGKND